MDSFKNLWKPKRARRRRIFAIETQSTQGEGCNNYHIQTQNSAARYKITRTEESHNKACSKQIDVELRKSAQEDNLKIKLVLLGPSNAGKSSVMKQVTKLYGNPPNAATRGLYIHSIHQHIVARTKALLSDHEDSTQCKALLSLLKQEENDSFSFAMAEIVREVWHVSLESKISTEANKIKIKYHDLEYFTKSLDRIFNRQYVPSHRDLLYVRIPTVGLRKEIIHYNKMNFEVYDVGGQSVERRKWVHYLDATNTIVFVVPIGDFDEASLQCPHKTKLTEALEIFAEICNNHHLMRVDLFLFFNKSDIFLRKITSTDMSSIPHLQDFPGDPADTKLVMKYFCYLFLKCNPNSKRKIIGHWTCALDLENIEQVFNVSMQNLLRNYFSSCGLCPL